MTVGLVQKDILLIIKTTWAPFRVFFYDTFVSASKRIQRCPWCVDDYCAPGWVNAMPQAGVLGKAAGHLGVQNLLSEYCIKHQTMGHESIVEVQ
jgi:hypothetical protein